MKILSDYQEQNYSVEKFNLVIPALSKARLHAGDHAVSWTDSSVSAGEMYRSTWHERAGDLVILCEP